MSLLAQAVVVLAAWHALGHWRPSWQLRGAILVGLLLLFPLPALLISGGVGAFLARDRLRARRRARQAADADVTQLAELTLLGISGGLTFVGSLDMASGHVAPQLRAEVRRTLRRSRHQGTAMAFVRDQGRARDLYRIAARTSITGAPVMPALESFVDERRADQRAAAVATARRLPVRLLFPLALLILPGFMVLTIGPAILEALQRLSS